MKNIPIIFGLLLILATACTKEKVMVNPITIKSTATYGGAPLVLYTPVDYFGMNIKVITADFMISGFTLSGSNKVINTPDTVFMLKFTDSNLTNAGAKEGIVKTFNADEWVYNNLFFGVGVDSSINKKRPEDFNTSPLNDGYYYWEAWKSYIFLKVEGTFDADGDGNYEGGFAYHIGTSDLFKILSLPVNLNAGVNANNQIHLNFDIKDVLGAGGDFIDMKLTPSSHNPKDVAISQKIYNHLSTAITIK